MNAAKVTVQVETSAAAPVCACCDEAIFHGQQFARCGECDRRTHVSCWKRVGGCPMRACNRTSLEDQFTGTVALPSCTYCLEPITPAAKGQGECPHCGEILRVDYHTCPLSIRFTAGWIRLLGLFAAGVTALCGLLWLYVLFFEKPGRAIGWEAIGGTLIWLLLLSPFAAISYGLLSLATGLRRGRSSSLGWARFLCGLQSLTGNIIGVVCLIALSRPAAVAYCQD